MERRISIAAIRMHDGTRWLGTNHAEIIRIIASHGYETPITGSQGFITSDDEFVSREEAARIAHKAGQIKAPVEFLYSENLIK